MTWRVLILCLCLLTAGAFLGRAASAEPTPMRLALSELPLVIGERRGRPNADFSKEVLSVLKVDDYITRTYVTPEGTHLGLYVGYHASQRQGASIHSPLNCLPGAGWLPIDQRRKTLSVPTGNGGRRVIEVNEVVIERGLDRQLVLYWYQSQGRVVASEYWGKVYSVVDAIRNNRTDAALVRVIIPLLESQASDETLAEGTKFVEDIFPLLDRHLPS